MKNQAKYYYKNGYSCSEAIIQAARECGYINSQQLEDLNKIASAFSGGMGAGCLCGAVSGAQIVLGVLLGRKNLIEPNAKVKQAAKTLVEKFKEKRKVTCCKVLSSGFEFADPKRRENCANIVEEAAEILDEILKHSLVK